MVHADLNGTFNASIYIVRARKIIADYFESRAGRVGRPTSSLCACTPLNDIDSVDDLLADLYARAADFHRRFVEIAHLIGRSSRWSELTVGRIAWAIDYSLACGHYTDFAASLRKDMAISR
jgi:hypothetical protein